jgi:hypothetical protein
MALAQHTCGQLALHVDSALADVVLVDHIRTIGLFNAATLCHGKPQLALIHY